MADRVVENDSPEVPEIPEVLESAMLFALGEAKEKMGNGDVVVPFTVLVVKDNLFIETHPGSTAEECFNLARHTVQNARGATAYVFCYDGYVETDDGVKDSLIAEGGMPGDDTGFAAGYLYKEKEGGEIVFEEEAAYIGEAPNFMIALRKPGEYDDDEVNSRFGEEDAVDEDLEFDLSSYAEEASGAEGIDWSDTNY